MDEVKNDEMRGRAGMASTTDQRVLRWFGHAERKDVYRMYEKGVDGECKWWASTG